MQVVCCDYAWVVCGGCAPGYSSTSAPLEDKAATAHTNKLTATGIEQQLQTRTHIANERMENRLLGNQGTDFWAIRAQLS